MEDIVIVAGVRTPVGKFQGSLDGFTAACAKLPEVKEVYEADWGIEKD